MYEDITRRVIAAAMKVHSTLECHGRLRERLVLIIAPEGSAAPAMYTCGIFSLAMREVDECRAGPQVCDVR
jgi:hypothetical protein